MHPLPPHIFKAYDIRGIVGESLTAAHVERIGRALAGAALALGQRQIALGRDGRPSSPELARALARGMLAGGLDVIDLGAVTTPMTYFAAHHLACGNAAMVTGSHNPAEYNGIKLMLAGEALAGAAIQALRARAEADAPVPAGNGRLRALDVAAAYQQRIVDDVRLVRPLDIVVDAGNGIAGAHAPALLRTLGCRVEAMYCEVDGRFPHHHPDPSVADNLADLRAQVRARGADLGLAFDGDGDRLGVVARDGTIIQADRVLMLLADDVLARARGATVIYDVKSTRLLHDWIVTRGGVPLLWSAGHSKIKSKMRETGAALAGELSGHLFFAERWYGFDDALYAAARLIEYLARQPDLDATLCALPDSVNTPELLIPMREGEAHGLIEGLRAGARFAGARAVIELDGLRVEYADGFGLLRASNTTPALSLRFEGDDADALRRIQDDFRALLHTVAPTLRLPF